MDLPNSVLSTSVFTDCARILFVIVLTRLEGNNYNLHKSISRFHCEVSKNAQILISETLDQYIL